LLPYFALLRHHQNNITMRVFVLLSVALAVMLSACSKDEVVDLVGTTGCDSTLLPVVMCHGFLASGDTYALQAKRFAANSHCGDRVHAFDWNTLGGGSSVDALDAFIDEILANTGAAQVNLAGHSAGGGLGYNYLADAGRAAKVAHYVHIGSNPQEGPAGPDGSVPTMNIWSPYDAVVEGADIPGAENIVLQGKDHYEVATSAETFEAMYRFFNGKEAGSSAIVGDNSRSVAGRVLTLGENQPLAGASVRVFELEGSTGFRKDAAPAHSFTTDSKGNWGSFTAGEGVYYEFEVTPAETNGRKLHYYLEPFITSDHLVYLRAMPPSGTVAGLLLSSLPKNDQQAVVIAFASSHAVIAGRDNLVVNGLELSTQTFASEDDSAIAFFLYDNGNGQTDGTAVGLYGNFPFLSGVDMFFPTEEPESITLTLNGRALKVRNWPSQTEGITVAVFD
jgi:pimeloyl-ACP methyl ester carboxylesterase